VSEEDAIKSLPRGHKWTDLEELGIYHNSRSWGANCKNCDLWIEYHEPNSNKSVTESVTINKWVVWCSDKTPLATCEEVFKANQMEYALG